MPEYVPDKQIDPPNDESTELTEDEHYAQYLEV